MRASLCLMLTSAAFLAGTSASAACLQIDAVSVEGAALLPPEEVTALTAPVADRCVPFLTVLAEIDDVLQALTLAYVDQGYIAARAWLPEQNLGDGTLEIRVVEGRLGAILFNGSEDARWEARSFPGLREQPVQLRSVEQGLDVIRSMPGFDAQMELAPGDAEGVTDLDLTTTGRPWQLRLSSTNLGSDEADEGAAAATGQFITALDGSISHAFGFNETFQLNLSRSQPDHPLNLFHAGPRTRSGNVSVDVPTGAFNFRANVGWSDYATEIPGAFSPIAVDGDTRTIGLGGSALLARDQTSKTRMTFGLTRRANENRIADVRIDTSSRVLTSARYGLAHERAEWGGAFEALVGFEHGLRLFGAEDARAQPEGQPDAQYALWDAELRFRRLFEAGSSRIGYATSLRGQWSNDLLYGTQQFNLGGGSSVRGSKAVLASGNTGHVWRNEVFWRTPAALPEQLGVFELYVTADRGAIAAQDDAGIAGGVVRGSSFGARLVGGRFDIDASYGRIFEVPAGISRPNGDFLISAGWRF